MVCPDQNEGRPWILEILKLAVEKDSVPNVQICACRIVQRHKKKIGKNNWELFKNPLRSFLESEDRDVQFYANQAITAPFE